MNQMMINPQRGEIWLVNFNPQVGDEMGKARPAIVFSVDGMSRLQLRIIIPITDWKDVYQHHYTKVQLNPSKLNGLSKPSAADTFQVKSVSLQRFVGNQPLGRLPLADLTDIGVALKIATGIK
jgi:mRNA interferase MazF